MRDGDDKNWDRGRGRERQQERGERQQEEMLTAKYVLKVAVKM